MNTDLMFSSEGDYWRTPVELVAWLNRRYEFTLDAAASDTLVAPGYYNVEMDALTQPWTGRVFCNPPYSNVSAFVRHGIREWQSMRADGVCFLVPARTDTGWWHDAMPASTTIFLKGRLKFWLQPEELFIINEQRAARGKKPLKEHNAAPFPSALLLYGFGDLRQRTYYQDWRVA